MFPGKVPAGDELHAIMQMLASLDMAADTAERLVDHILTMAEERLAIGVAGLVNSKSDSSASLSPSLDSVPDSSESTPSPLPLDSSQPSSTSLSPSLDSVSDSSESTPSPLPLDSSQPSDIAPSTEAGSFLAQSIQAMQTAIEGMQTALDGTMVAMSLNPTPSSTTNSSSPDVKAPSFLTTVNSPTSSTSPGVITPAVPPFNANGPLHLVGAPGSSLESHNGFAYEVPEPDALGPFYLVTRGARVGVFSGWHVTSPYVIGVSRASFTRVPTVAAGLAQLIQAINNGVAMWLA